ncbi:MAG: protein tyrosine phosphatase [Sphingobacteriaceae bacterium]|nr:MAG: protein tyrosine phosphatase [Sphingobacteriaceae bacterium]
MKIKKQGIPKKINSSTLSNLLFICSKNQWRSPTAELLFKNHAVHTARSAGTSDKARIKANQKMIDWADVIFVMERRHKELLKQRFTTQGKQLEVLDIEDNYLFGDSELIGLLKDSLTEYL